MGAAVPLLEGLEVWVGVALRGAQRTQGLEGAVGAAGDAQVADF